MDEDDVPQPVLRMPCSYSNIMTLNLESYDVVGAFEAMKRIMKVLSLYKAIFQSTVIPNCNFNHWLFSVTGGLAVVELHAHCNEANGS